VGFAMPVQLAFAVGSMTVNENAGSATFQVVRSGSLQGVVSVNVATSGGSAVAGVNYTAVSELLTFAAGQASQTITIPVKDDGVATPDLTVDIVLSSPGGGALLGSLSSATLVIHEVDRSSTPPPLVTVQRVQELIDSRHRLTEIVIGFSGLVNSVQTQNTSEYRLAAAGTNGSFTARNARVIKLRSAVYDTANGTVTLALQNPLALTKPVQLTVNGSAPLGITDSLGRLIDGDRNRKAGGNAVVVLSRKGAVIRAIGHRPLYVAGR
jgi:hypothetical protein